MNKLNAHFTPAPQANILNAAGASGVPAGAVNLIGSPSGQNLPQVSQAAGGINLFAAPPSPGPGTTSAPLGQGSITPGPTAQPPQQPNLTAGQKAAIQLQAERDRQRKQTQEDERAKRIAERAAKALAAANAQAAPRSPTATPPPGLGP